MAEVVGNYDRNRPTYLFLLILSLVFIFAAIYTNAYTNLFLAVPTLLLTLIGFQRKNRLNLPPLFLIFLGLSMILLQLTKFLEGEHYFLWLSASLTLGVFNGLLGLMIIMAMLRSSPGFDVERPFFVSFTAFCIGNTLSLALNIADLYVYVQPGVDGYTVMWEFMTVQASATVGDALVCALFYLNRHNNLFKHTLDRFLKENADTIRSEARAKADILKEIQEGESSKLEFKTTLRTNLKTGEKDPRMERAVLKTVVAFLNSKGGTLLIGVADDGTIAGVDIESFENSRDKFGLHLNNLLTQQIGGEFLPYINYNLFDFDGKYVMKVTVKHSDRPVFLKDGKEQIFYVRSGPATIDLHGIDLLNYASRTYGNSLKKLV